MADLQSALAQIERLKAENARLTGIIGRAAQSLRGPLRADTLNEAIRALNTALDKDQRISEVAWGVASLGALQAAVRNLAQIVALPEYAAFLTQRINYEPPPPMKRQGSGGVPLDG